MHTANGSPLASALRSAWVPFVLPFALYLGLTQITAHYPGYYPQLYAGIVLVMALVLATLLRRQTALVMHGRILAALATGAFGIVLWIAISRLQLEHRLSDMLPGFLRPAERVGFNPFSRISDPFARWCFIAARLLGLAVIVPLAEELFWRGFLVRWLNSPDWEAEPLGRFTVRSFAGVTILFTLAHPEWFAAASYAALLNGYFLWKRDLFGCVVAHAVSNLLLGCYVLGTGSWELW